MAASTFDTNFRRVKVVGQGAHGKAHLVTRIADNQSFVVKEIQLDRMSPKERELFSNEVTTLKSISSPFVIRYNGSFMERGILYLVMEYADAGDLKSKIRQRYGVAANPPYSEEQIICWFVQLLAALAHLHGRGILHRDLKPDNVFLLRSGVVKLGDFGISKQTAGTAAPPTAAHTVCGTVGYMPPEIVQNRPYGPKADMWSLGVILFELCCGRVPYRVDQGILAYSKAIVEGPVPACPRALSPHLASVLNNLLQPDPTHRPSAVELLQVPFLRTHMQSCHLMQAMGPTVRAPVSGPGQCTHPDGGSARPRSPVGELPAVVRAGSAPRQTSRPPSQERVAAGAPGSRPGSRQASRSPSPAQQHAPTPGAHFMPGGGAPPAPRRPPSQEGASTPPQRGTPIRAGGIPVLIPAGSAPPMSAAGPHMQQLPPDALRAEASARHPRATRRRASVEPVPTPKESVRDRIRAASPPLIRRLITPSRTAAAGAAATPVGGGTTPPAFERPGTPPLRSAFEALERNAAAAAALARRASPPRSSPTPPPSPFSDEVRMPPPRAQPGPTVL